MFRLRSPESSGGQIESREDVQAFFDAVVPSLLATFSELADQLTFVEAAPSVAAFVTPVPPNSYQGSFDGTLSVGGAFVGELEVNRATAQWMNPVTESTTFWDATVTVAGTTYIVSSEGLPPDPSSGDCSACVGENAAPDGFEPNRAVDCPGSPVDFACSCLTESGETLTFYPSGDGCSYRAMRHVGSAVVVATTLVNLICGSRVFLRARRGSEGWCQ